MHACESVRWVAVRSDAALEKGTTPLKFLKWIVAGRALSSHRNSELRAKIIANNLSDAGRNLVFGLKIVKLIFVVPVEHVSTRNRR